MHDLKHSSVEPVRKHIARTVIEQLDEDRVHTVTVGSGDTATVIRYADVQTDAVAWIAGYSTSEYIQGDAADVADYVIQQVEREVREADDVTVSYDAGCAPVLNFDQSEVDIDA